MKRNLAGTPSSRIERDISRSWVWRNIRRAKAEVETLVLHVVDGGVVRVGRNVAA